MLEIYRLVTLKSQFNPNHGWGVKKMSCKIIQWNSLLDMFLKLNDSFILFFKLINTYIAKIIFYANHFKFEL